MCQHEGEGEPPLASDCVWAQLMHVAAQMGIMKAA